MRRLGKHADLFHRDWQEFLEQYDTAEILMQEVIEGRLERQVYGGYDFETGRPGPESSRHGMVPSLASFRLLRADAQDREDAQLTVGTED